MFSPTVSRSAFGFRRGSRAGGRDRVPPFLASTASVIEFGSGFGVSIRPSTGRMIRKKREVVDRADLRQRHVDAFRRPRAEPAEEDGVDDEQPEEQLVPGTVDRRAHLRRVEPRQDEQHGDRTEHRQHAAELGIDRADVEGDGAQDRVERQEVPFRHDVRRRLQRVGLDVVVRMAEIVRHVEDEIGEDREEHDHRERVLDGRVGRERHRVGLRLHLDAGRVGLAGHMQRPDVQDDDAGDHERQQVVQREEAVERRIVDREAAEQQLLDPARRPAGWR